MKILFINPFGIGDVIFTTPLLGSIKKNIPDSVISFWCNRRVKDLFKSDPRIDKVFALTKGDLKHICAESKLEGARSFLSLLYRLKRERFDATFDFSLDHRYGLITKLLGIKKRVGFNYKNRGRFLTERIDIDGYSGRHIAEYYLDLLRFVGGHASIKKPEIFVAESDSVKCKNLFSRLGVKDGDAVVGIAAAGGLSWGKNASLKQWPAVRYARLADKIIDDTGARILLLGDVCDKPAGDIITAAMKNKAMDLTGKTTLPELIALIKNLRLLIANDGGPLHIAAALDTKTVSIFGPVDDAVYGPYPASERHNVVKKDIACRPCYRKFRVDICHNRKECINSITVEEVYAAARRQL